MAAAGRAGAALVKELLVLAVVAGAASASSSIGGHADILMTPVHLLLPQNLSSDVLGDPQSSLLLTATKRDQQEDSDFFTSNEDGSAGKYEDYDDDEDEEVLPAPAYQKSDDNTYIRDDLTFMVQDPDGVVCIMVYFIGQATVYYPDTTGQYISKVFSPPEKPEISGMCDRSGQVCEIQMSWSAFTMAMKFGKDDTTDSWFVSQFRLKYDLNDPVFDDVADDLGEVELVSEKDRKFWQTSNLRSFRCLLLHDIKLKDDINNNAKLHFDQVRIQAFSEDKYFRT
ncbi:unnamed protein product, partial [Meganyctiphanes norvegica]